MGGASLPPGFRFHPTDTELILYYLKRKVLGKPLRIPAVQELHLYKFAPWDLPDKSCLKSSDLEWYFFCPRDKKYNNGPRVNRATEIGFWKTTGKDRPIYNDCHKVGIKKTLIFHLGRAPQGTRTNWVMHEYRLEIKDWLDADISQESYVLCKIFEKSGAGPKNGEQRAAPFKEEEWEDNMVDNSLMPLPLLDSASSSVVSDVNEIIATADDTLVLGKTSDSSVPTCCQNASSDACRETPSLLEDANMDSLLAILGEENDFSLREKPSSLEAADMDLLLAILGEENDVGCNLNDANQMPDSLHDGCNVKAPALLDGNDIFGGLEDLNTRTKPKGNDNLDLTDVEGKYGLGQTLLGDSVTYMELNDLDCALKYPLTIDDPKVIQYGDFQSRLEIGCTDSFGLHNSPLPEKHAFPVGLNENFVEEYPFLGKLKNVTSGAHIGLNHHDCVGDLPLPFVSSKAGHLASEVVSSQSMLPQDFGVLLDNKDVASDVLQDHIGCCGIAVPKYKDARQVPEFHLGGNRQTENDKNSSQAFSRGEQHTANSLLQCLLGSIPAHHASAAEGLSSKKAGKGHTLSANHYGSSIHVKAEVIVRSWCTEEALAGKLEGSPCLCCYGHKFPRKELEKGAAACSCGFTFVLLLGVVTALMWVVVYFSMVVKLGWCGWKLTISIAYFFDYVLVSIEQVPKYFL